LVIFLTSSLYCAPPDRLELVARGGRQVAFRPDLHGIRLERLFRIEHEGQRFSVDFSAAQFGTGDAFPLVQRHVAGDVWEREWMSASREAA